MKQADITNDKTRSLFDLGQVADGGPWIDYLQYGFDESDVPALLELVADDSLNNADTGSKAVWVPLHAWRALGQIGSDKAVAPLLGLFDSMQQDDWAFQELPGVIGMIGKSAVIPLCDYLSAAEHDEQARVMAVDALNEIVAHDPACKAVVIRCCQEYLSHPDESAGFLNGMVVACLLDLDAREAIDDIRRLFQKGCIDIAVAGDLEDVEIELGLRARRSTPRPGLFSLFDPGDPAELQEPEPGDTVFDPDDPAELQEPDPGDTFDVIEFNLLRYGNEDSIRDISELDGFFAALGCAPQTIMPSRWMPAIWGGGEQAPKWETEDDAQAFYSAVLALYNSIMHALVEQDFAPLFDEVGAADGAVSSAATWCAGFLRGLDLWIDEAPDDRAFIEARIEPIRLVASKACAEQPAGKSEGAILAEYGEITRSVTRLFEHYFARRAPGSQTLVRSQPKVGRNDPCPCGSGKKFKKCCLH